jgi:hypothetical protein
LAETLTLVDSIRDRSAEDHHSRPARAGCQGRLDPNLMITVTLEGRTIHEALTEHSSDTYPYGLVNAAFEHTARIPHLFVDTAERDHILDLYLIDMPNQTTLHLLLTWWILGRSDRICSLQSRKRVPGLLNPMGLAIPAPSSIHMGRNS